MYKMVNLFSRYILSMDSQSRVMCYGVEELLYHLCFEFQFGQVWYWDHTLKFRDFFEQG